MLSQCDKFISNPDGHPLKYLLGCFAEISKSLLHHKLENMFQTKSIQCLQIILSCEFISCRYSHLYPLRLSETKLNDPYQNSSLTTCTDEQSKKPYPIQQHLLQPKPVNTSLCCHGSCVLRFPHTLTSSLRFLARSHFLLEVSARSHFLFLCSTAQTPPLRQLCRWKLRLCLGPKRFKRIHELPIPRTLQQYLL